MLKPIIAIQICMLEFQAVAKRKVVTLLLKNAYTICALLFRDSPPVHLNRHCKHYKLLESHMLTVQCTLVSEMLCSHYSKQCTNSGGITIHTIGALIMCHSKNNYTTIHTYIHTYIQTYTLVTPKDAT